jgi:hypothetical protein
METIPTCVICAGIEMDFVEDLSRMNSRSGNAYRRRRYKCLICGYELVVMADGYRDEYNAGEAAKMDLKKQFKQEENNEDKLRS